MIAARRATKDPDRGAVAAEFALILPLLILVVFGIIQFAIAFNRQQAVHAAAREGARLASLPTTSESEACDRVEDALTGVPFPGGVDCSVVGDCGGGSERVVVNVSGVTELDIPFWGEQSLTITGRGEFRCE